MKSIKQSELNSFGLRVWKGSVRTTYPPHRHNEIELNAIEFGYFTYLLAGSEVTITAGELGLFWGAIPHQVIDFAPATRLYWATIPLDHILHWELPQAFIRALLNGTFFRDPKSLYNLAFFERWEHDLAAGQQAFALMEIRSLCFRFAQTDQPAPVPVTMEMNSSRANQMALFMSHHFQERLTVSDIAAQVGLHPGYAMTIFRETFGLSLIEYLSQQRIAHAQQLLITTDLPITEVAFESGFPTLSHFYTAFKRLCSLSPGKYRASMRYPFI